MFCLFQTEGGGDIHISHKGNGTTVYLDDINLTKIIQVWNMNLFELKGLDSKRRSRLIM